MISLSVTLQAYPRVYACEVHATRSRATLYYRFWVIQADRTPLDITAAVAESLHTPLLENYGAVGWPGSYGAVYALQARLQSIGGPGVSLHLL